jgi:hypothetical protein
VYIALKTCKEKTCKGKSVADQNKKNLRNRIPEAGKYSGEVEYCREMFRRIPILEGTFLP